MCPSSNMSAAMNTSHGCHALEFSMVKASASFCDTGMGTTVCGAKRRRERDLQP